ncbi:MAG: hypothetical protein HQ522_19875 [Bacteroidetes bacterium]|nr:hypothetical protein [Bacteroidota bacterium]
MKYITILIILVVSINIHAQTSTKFADLIEVTGDDKIKIYLNGNFQIAYKDCADYYMLADFDDNYFQIKDTIKVFYMNDKLFIYGKYEKGQVHGNFKILHQNGKLKLLSQYDKGKPIGIWKYYYENGNLHKVVGFRDNRIFLAEMYNKNGKTLVQNGNGTFNDVISLSKFDDELFEINGAVKNGLPDGKWQIALRGTIFATEFFEGYIFKEGISHSKALGDYKYYNNHQSKFVDVTSIESLKINHPGPCQEKFDIGLSGKFFDKLKGKYEKSELKSELGNQWFLIEVEANDNGKIVNVEIISKSDKQTVDQLKKMISSVGRTFSNIKPFSGYKYFTPVSSQSCHFRTSCCPSADGSASLHVAKDSERSSE